MTAIEIREPGGPDVLAPVQRPVPTFGDDEVLIRIAAAGVNRPDCLQRQGLYPPPPGASDIPGLEVAGTVVAAGSSVDDLDIGDRVCALLTGGGYAEYCVAPAIQCLSMPAGFTFTAAAALPETFFTVWTNVFDRAQLAAGETILVHGGASGIGTTAIQLARAFGARVFATVGNDEKRAFCEDLGAERAINYRDESFLDVIKAQVGGVDVILDIVGGKYLDDNVKLLKPDGRLVVIAVLGGAKAELNLARVMMKRLQITGSTLRAREPEFKGGIARSLRNEVWPKLVKGELKPIVQATFPLADAARAHEILDANQAMGKIVLTVEGDA
ncbi:MAG: NAD(P)H-quinone oxidoreductase [Gammaproteobacteria bacterium]|nr:NAD(P)H-quinone oxidoreductase [Gammaproteobacteria bacterium]